MESIPITHEDTIINTGDGYPLVIVGKGTYAGSIFIHSLIDMDDQLPYLFQIGRYTSIGDNLNIISNLNHDYKSVFQGAIPEFEDEKASTYRLKKGQNDAYMEQKGMILIGNDVWIGDNVTIISDVTVGNGAVIAAGSVVVRDVPPYTIYGGNPARFIKKRFDNEMAKLFQRIAWWNYDSERLIRAKDDMMGDPQAFVKKYGDKVVYYEETSLLDLTSKGTARIIIAFLDIETNYNTFGNILVEFCRTFSEGQAELVLCFDPLNDAECQTADMLSDVVTKLPEGALFRLVPIEADMEEVAISEADYFIVGRGTKNIRLVSYAFKYDVTCLSGVNIPVFDAKIIGEICNRKCEEINGKESK